MFYLVWLFALVTDVGATDSRLIPSPESLRAENSLDTLPRAAAARFGTSLWRHGESIRSLALSPDGKIIASGGVLSAVRLWDITTGKETRTLLPDSKTIKAGALSASSVFSVAFSPDGKLLAVGYSTLGLRLYDLSTGKQVFKARPSRVGITSVCFTQDGKAVVSGDERGAVQVWEISTGKELKQLSGHSKRVTSMAAAPQGNLLVSTGEDKAMRLWDVSTGREERKIESPSGRTI